MALRLLSYSSFVMNESRSSSPSSDRRSRLEPRCNGGLVGPPDDAPFSLAAADAPPPPLSANCTRRGLGSRGAEAAARAVAGREEVPRLGLDGTGRREGARLASRRGEAARAVMAPRGDDARAEALPGRSCIIGRSCGEALRIATRPAEVHAACRCLIASADVSLTARLARVSSKYSAEEPAAPPRCRASAPSFDDMTDCSGDGKATPSEAPASMSRSAPPPPRCLGEAK